MNEDKNVKDMTREELEQEVNYLRTKYIWGLEPEDFASATAGAWPESTTIYSQDELSNEELRTKFFANHTNVFGIDDWSDAIYYYARDTFTQEDWNIMSTMKDRKLTYEND